MIWLNGKQSGSISITDRGLQYGDGCFTTMLLKDGLVRQWERHLERLKQSTAALGIGFDDWTSLEKTVYEAAKLSEAKAVVKVVITRGSGGRGYSPAGCCHPNVLVYLTPYPAHYDKWQQQGISLINVVQTLGHSSLAGIKHLNRLEQVLVKQELDQRKAVDGLVCDINGNIVETSASNIFWRIGDTLFTPDLSLSGVEGIMRRSALEIAGECGYKTKIVVARPEVLKDADEVFVTNAVMELVPVNRIENTDYHQRAARDILTLRLEKC